MNVYLKLIVSKQLKKCSYKKVMAKVSQLFLIYHTNFFLLDSKSHLTRKERSTTFVFSAKHENRRKKFQIFTRFKKRGLIYTQNLFICTQKFKWKWHKYPYLISLAFPSSIHHLLCKLFSLTLTYLIIQCSPCLSSNTSINNKVCLFLLTQKFYV